MKTKLILILILFSVSSTLFGQVQFSHTNISNANSQAASTGLPYFVYIYGDWCLPCQIMEETTFKSLDLQDAIDQKYTAYKVDFHSEAGVEWVAAHDVCCLPSFIFFDEQGNKIQQIQSPLTASGFMQVLESPQSYSKRNEDFADANSSERLKSQVSSQEKMVKHKENLAIVTNPPTTLSQQNTDNFTASKGDYSEHNQLVSENAIMSTTAPTLNDNKIETEDIGNKSDFLNELRKHISSLEAVYASYEQEESDNSGNLQNISPLAEMEGFKTDTDAKSDCECENIAKNAEELAKTIKELKGWETQLDVLTNQPQPPVKSALITTSAPIASPTFISNISEKRAYYSVQMGMFKTEAYARRMVDDLANNYTYSIEMKTIEKSGSTLHRVLLGPFMEESEAKEAYSKMRNDGRKAVVGVF